MCMRNLVLYIFLHLSCGSHIVLFDLFAAVGRGILCFKKVKTYDDMLHRFLLYCGTNDLKCMLFIISLQTFF